MSAPTRSDIEAAVRSYVSDGHSFCYELDNEVLFVRLNERDVRPLADMVELVVRKLERDAA